MSELQHECEENDAGHKVEYDPLKEAWMCSIGELTLYTIGDRCPHCKEPLPSPPGAKPDDVIAVTRNCLETWAYLAEEMPAYGDFREMLARSIREVIPVGGPGPEPNEGAELRRLQGIEKVLLSDITGSEYSRERAVDFLRYLAKELKIGHAGAASKFSRLADALEREPGTGVRMVKVTWALLDDWDKSLRGIAIRAYKKKTASDILSITAHMRSILNC